MLIHHVPSVVPRLFTDFVWHKDRTQKTVYLTFDDGPVPGVTDYVLKQLELRNQQATFFMVGENVTKNAALAKTVQAAGHGIGNHTYHHLNGYHTATLQYYQDVFKCQRALEDHLGVTTTLFRPPYGRISKKQIKLLKNHFQIILWDVLSGDYDVTQSHEKCLYKTQKYTRSGSVIVFHDQLKTQQMLKFVLPTYLDFLLAQGYQTSILT
jgi:peptidoglycan-N-acetylglucosamine deacetylase